MKHREIITTSDGSQTIFIPELNENYHSVHGAIQESMHVYINAGLAACEKKEITVFEMGFGTGLNALLTCQYAHQHQLKIKYVAVEKYPLTHEEITALDFEKESGWEEQSILKKMHEVKEGVNTTLSDRFELQLCYSDIQDFNIDKEIDVCYYDAFAPDIQPQLWTAEIFAKVHDAMASDGILSTYSAKGLVKRNLKSVGFQIEKLPGPPGKREIIRAIK